VSITLHFCTSYRSASRHYSVPFPISSVKQTCQLFAQLISTLQHRSRLTTMALFSKISNFFLTIYILSWDALLSVLNFILPNKKIGHIVPPGHPGEGGKWGEYIAPKEGDSRCSCPAMNAMANHGKSIKLCPLCGVIFTRVNGITGILPRDGKNISFKEMSRTVHATYNFAPTFSLYVPNFIAGILGKSYSKDTLDLAEIDKHNGIEHDASLTRECFPPP
jgi:hypothetical protein